MLAAEVETVKEGLSAARGAAKSGIQELRDLKDDARHQVKRRPMESVGAAFSVGLVIGAVVGWIARRPRG